MKKMIKSLCASVAVAAFAASANAAIVQLGIVGDLQLGPNYVDFGNFPTGTIYATPPGSGIFEVSLLNDPILSPDVTTGELGAIQSINDATGSITLASPFMTFATGGSNFELFATDISPGTSGMFTETDTAQGAVVAFNINGVLFDTNLGKDVANFTSTFSATFGGLSVAQLADNQPINTPFSASFNFSPIVPEPASLSLLAASGLLMLRRRRRITN